MSLPNDLPEEEFLHWVKATLGLQVAKRASCNYIKYVMTDFIDGLKKIHKTEEEDHFDTLFNKVMFRGEVKRSKTKGILSWILYDQSCQDCKRVFDRMFDEFNDGKDCTEWKRHCLSDTFKPDLYWWIVSKIYISNKCKVTHTTGPEDVDPFALFSLMRNCKQFDQYIKHQACSLIGLRHELMHSSNNTLKKEQMEDSFAMIKDYIDVIKNNKSDMPTEVINDLDNALVELDTLKKKELGIFDKANNLHDCTKKAVHIQQQCLRTDFDIPFDSEFDIISKLITRIERKKCENEKQQLRDELTRIKTEKESQAKESYEEVRTLKIILDRAMEETKSLKALNRRVMSFDLLLNDATDHAELLIRKYPEVRTLKIILDRAMEKTKSLEALNRRTRVLKWTLKEAAWQANQMKNKYPETRTLELTSKDAAEQAKPLKKKYPEASALELTSKDAAERAKSLKEKVPGAYRQTFP
ncbi:Chromosome X 38 [Mactra antiquata]